MAEKDIAEHNLANYPDIFADIINACIFILTGRWPSRPVRPEELVDAPSRNYYRSGGKTRALARDVVKFWTAGETVLCLMGLENQTKVDPDMPLRVIGYEGGDYRRQATRRDEAAQNKGEGGRKRRRKKQKPYPILTIVLYFGTKRRWPKNKRNLLDLFTGVDESLRPLLNNCRLNVVELAFLTEEQAAAFKSDFRIVVDYLRQTRLNREYVPSDQVIVHVEAVMHLLSALTGDSGLVENLPDIQKRGEPMTVRNFFGEARQEAKAQGIQIGKAEGIQIGKAEGFLGALFSCVQDGLLQLSDAAKKAGMTEDEFRARMPAHETTRH